MDCSVNVLSSRISRLRRADDSTRTPFSRTMKEAGGNTSIVRDDLEGTVAALKQKPGKPICVGKPDDLPQVRLRFTTENRNEESGVRYCFRRCAYMHL